MIVKGFFKGFWEGFRHLCLTPAGGSKRHAEQQAYENLMDAAMERARLAEEEETKRMMMR